MNKHAKLTREQILSIVELSRAGVNKCAIQRQTGITRATVAKVLAGRLHSDMSGIAPVTPAPISARKLTDQEVLDILRKRSEGCGLRSLSAQYGVSRVALQLLLAGRTYKSVPRPQEELA